MARITRKDVGEFLGYALIITFAIGVVAIIGGICEHYWKAPEEPAFPYVVEWFEVPDGETAEYGISAAGQFASQQPGGDVAVRLIPLDQLGD